MITKEIIDQNSGHILIRSNEPIRIEILNTLKGFVMYVYKGTKINKEQEPTLFHDSELGGQNEKRI